MQAFYLVSFLTILLETSDVSSTYTGFVLCPQPAKTIQQTDVIIAL